MKAISVDAPASASSDAYQTVRYDIMFLKDRSSHLSMHVIVVTYKELVTQSGLLSH